MITRGKKSASRGFVNNIILESLMTGDKYGYEIIKEVEDKSGGKIILKQPSLYSSLKRFEQRGLISSYWGDSDVGGRRHYYTITELGKQYVQNKSAVGKQTASQTNAPTKNEDEDEKFDEVSLSDLGEIFPTNSYEVDTSDGNDDLTDEYINKISNLREKVNSENTNDHEDEIDSNEASEEESNEESEESEVEEDTSTTNSDTTEESPSNDEENEELIDINNSDIEEEDTESESVDKDINDTLSHKPEIDTTNIQTKDAFLQPDLFANHEESNNITDNEIVLDHNSIKNVKSDTPTQEDESVSPTENEDKSIPLVKENSNIFFNWDEMKRQSVANKSFFDNKQAENKEHTDNQDKSDTVPTSVNLEQEMNLGIKDETDNTQNEEPAPKNDAVYILSAPHKDANNINVTLTPSDPNLSIPKAKTSEQHTENTYNVQDDDIDYKNILGELYTSEQNNNYEDIVAGALNDESSQEDEDNMVDYSYEPKDIVSSESIIDDKLDRLLEDGFKFKPYRVEAQDTTNERLFVKSNKLIFALSFFIGFLQIASIIGLYYILKATKHINSDHNIFFLIGLCIGALCIIYGMFRYAIAPYHRKIATPQHFRSQLTISLVAFLILIVLTLGINMLFGMQLSNIDLFYTTLFVPMITAIMIPIATILYYAFLTRRTFYK